VFSQGSLDLTLFPAWSAGDGAALRLQTLLLVPAVAAGMSEISTVTQCASPVYGRPGGSDMFAELGVVIDQVVLPQLACLSVLVLRQCAVVG
jgi:hypothetical protein